MRRKMLVVGITVLVVLLGSITIYSTYNLNDTFGNTTDDGTHVTDNPIVGGFLYSDVTINEYDEEYSIVVKNIDKHDALVRLSAFIAEEAICGDLSCSIGIETEKWVLGDDGYYYYKGKLKAGETTEPLMVDCEDCDNISDIAYLGETIYAGSVSDEEAWATYNEILEEQYNEKDF